jgi:hypothetical protein
MKRRFAWFLGLSLAASQAWSQEVADQIPAEPVSTEKAQDDTPRAETPAPAPAPAPIPAAEAPATEVFLESFSPRPSVAVGVQFLQWWYKRDAIPSLLNTGVETNSGFAGTAVDPNAISLFGNNQYAYHTVPGIRLNVAVALYENLDLEFNGFLMETRSVTQVFAGTNGQPFLTRPFYNQHDVIESGFDTSSKFGGVDPATGQLFPNTGISGNIAFHARNQLYGLELNAASNVNFENSAINKLLFGFRQVTLVESLSVFENVSTNSPNVLSFYGAAIDPATQSIRIFDGFSTRNEFYGPQLGANGAGLAASFRSICSPKSPSASTAKPSA